MRGAEGTFAVIGIWLFIIVIIVLIRDFTAVIMCDVAKKKGYVNNTHIFAICFFLGIFGCIYTLALPDLTARKNQEIIIELLGGSGKGSYDDELPDLE